MTDSLEIGWRLLPQYWHQGYAIAGAKAVLNFAFRKLRLDRVISFTAVLNTPSEQVMKKLGIDKVRYFDHPLIPEQHILRPHVLYEIHRSDYLHHTFC